MTRPLSVIKHCFDGSIPSGIATCSKDGVSNVTYLSQVHLIDDSHVGLSYQFFNKTRANIAENIGFICDMNEQSSTVRCSTKSRSSWTRWPR